MVLELFEVNLKDFRVEFSKRVGELKNTLVLVACIYIFLDEVYI